ncbi:MAG: cell division protein ZapA [Alphaproteobacteria bacterium]|nr:cell division protein ZapA [Alphaproteobacteria bacterium]
MSQLTIVVNGRSYSIACDDGQEEHLRKLGSFYSERVEELAGAMGQVGDARLMLMAGLMIADELSDAYEEIEKVKVELATLKSQNERNAPDQKVTELLSKLTGRIEQLADSLENAGDPEGNVAGNAASVDENSLPAT